MSRTVPCRTSSGIERQRLPPVQFAPGPPPAAILRSGLMKGSRRPFCASGLAGGFFSATTGATSAPLAGPLGAESVALAATGGLETVDDLVAATGAGALPDLAGAGVTGLAVTVLTGAGVGVALADAPVLFWVVNVPVATGALVAGLPPEVPFCAA